MILLPDATLQYRPEIGSIVVRWSNDSTTPALAQVYSELLEVAKDKSCYHWLLDVRRRDAINEELTAWVKEEFLPTVCNEVQASVKMAYLVSPRKARKLADRESLVAERTHVYHVCQTSIFDTEFQAAEWLKGKQ